ncbi:MAG TPA: sialidase family protein [Polyangiaceae bacterium]|nr:sialidase family protein [Polyangiaceae bacterium]
MSYLSAKPGEDRLIAGIALNGLWESTDGGQSWSALGQGPKSEDMANRPSFILYDPVAPKSWWVTGVYNGLGSFKTADDGNTFHSLGTEHNDYVSVDLSDRQRRTILISGHEADHLLHLSTDGGKTFSDIGEGEPKEAGACSYPLVIGSKTFLLGCREFGDGQSGIYRTEDAGESWAQVTPAGGAAAPLVTDDGTIYFASDFGGAVAKSIDQGQTWTLLNKVGTVDPAVGIIQLPDGRLATIGADKVIVSANGGESWQVVSVAAPFRPVGLVYSNERRAFFIWHFSCGETTVHVPDDGIMSYDFDYEAQ